MNWTLPKKPKNWITIDRVTQYGVLFLTVTSFILSYDAIRQLAVSSGVKESLSWLYPLSVDAVAIVAAVTVLRMTRTQDNKFYPWFVTVLFAAVSITFNILHYDSGAAWYATIAPWLAYVVHSIPPIAVMLGFHLFIIQKENDIRRGQVDTEADTDADITIATVDTKPDTICLPMSDEDKLTDRQRQVKSLMSQDWTQANIAKQLGVSTKTVSREVKVITDISNNGDGRRIE